jgi:hypothetical protein
MGRSFVRPMTVLVLGALLGALGCGAPTGTISGVASSTGATGAVRYPDGLPRYLDGQPVLRAEAALDYARGLVSATPFLLGGWVTVLPGPPPACPALPTAGSSPWLFACGQPAFSDMAGDANGNLVAEGELTFHFVDWSQLQSGPAILRVHVRDARASECGDEQTRCAQAMVVQTIVWTGDEATAPRPLDLSQTKRDLGSVIPGIDLAPVDGAPIPDCGPILPSTSDYLVTNPPADAPSVALVEIAPSSDALARALSIGEGSAAALSGPPLGITGSRGGFECRWLRVANVALIVHTSSPPRSTDRSFMNSLVAALGASP